MLTGTAFNLTAIVRIWYEYKWKIDYIIGISLELLINFRNEIYNLPNTYYKKKKTIMPNICLRNS